MEIAFALITVLGSLGGVFLGQYLAGNQLSRQLEHDAAQRVEERAHELALRTVEYTEGHRSRLLAERLGAYRQFALAHLIRKRADERVLVAWGAKHYQRLQNPIDPVAFDASQQSLVEAFDASGPARGAVEEAVAILQIVASLPVRIAAREVERTAGLRAKAEAAGYAKDDVDWQAVEEAIADLTQAEASLSDSISAELGLDR